MPPKAAQKPPTKIRKTTPKQPIAPSERLRRLFVSLCAQIDGGHFSNAIKTCDKILRLEPNDKDAVKTKLFLLLQTEQYAGALALIDAHEGQFPHNFERSYSLYRLHRETNAKVILEQIKGEGTDHRGALHLEAQLNYREGLFQASFESYNQLLDTAEPNSEEQSDILTNLQASEQHLEFLDKGFLHALDQLPGTVAANLESHPPPVVNTSAGTIAETSGFATTNEPLKQAQAARRTRNSRVPTGVVPGVTPPPDPERWLKKSERSTFGQGKRRKGGSGGATQGSANAELAASPAASGALKPTGGKGKKKK